jgi:AraC-like DNA-binding protein
MEFSFHTPPPELADSIKTIWCARGTKEEFGAPEPIVPDGCVEIVFNLGDPFSNAATGELQPGDLLAGQMTRPVVALPTGRVDLIGVRFHTARAGAALRIPMWELQDQLIAGSSAIAGLDKLVESTREQKDGDRIDHLAEGLRARLRFTERDANIDHALALIDRSRGNIAIERIAKRIGVSRRHLERLFRDRVGLGVKHLARISRLHAALEMLQLRPELSGAEIAADCGYSDQAHLIRECQHLAGQTPQQLKTTERSLAELMRAGECDVITAR